MYHFRHHFKMRTSGALRSTHLEVKYHVMKSKKPLNNPADLTPEEVIRVLDLAPLKRARVILSPDEIKDMLKKMQEHSGDIVYPITFVITHTGQGEKKSEPLNGVMWTLKTA